MDAYKNGRLCVSLVVDRLQKSGMSEYFPHTLEKSGYSYCRHGQDCTFRNYSKIPDSQMLGLIKTKYEFNFDKMIDQSVADKVKAA